VDYILIMVYVPEHFDTANLEDIKDLVVKVGMGTLITSGSENDIQASHIPVELRDREAMPTVVGHLARKNHQSTDLENATEALLIVQGPHGYISPRWYDHENVPTWDYAVVHFRGPLEVLSEEELKAHLRRLVKIYEPDNQAYKSPDQMIEDYVSEIIGFRLNTNKITPAFKLTQYKSRASVDGVVEGLKERQQPDDPELANLIKRHNQKK